MSGTYTWHLILEPLSARAVRVYRLLVALSSHANSSTLRHAFGACGTTLLLLSGADSSKCPATELLPPAPAPAVQVLQWRQGWCHDGTIYNRGWLGR